MEQQLAPVATLIVATVALYVGLRTVRQRDLADRRDQWWKRFVWATELTLAEDEPRRALGLQALELLAASRLAGPEESELVDVGMTAALSVRPELLDDGWDLGDDGQGDGGARDERA